MAASTSLKSHPQTQTQTQTQTQQPSNKPKRRKHHRETTISTSASSSPEPVNNSPPHSPSPTPTPAPAPTWPHMDSPGPPYPPPSYSKFNSALNAGLLNPMSPPPQNPITRSSPTLFDIMSNEQDYHPKPNTNTTQTRYPLAHLNQDPQLLLETRLSQILASSSPTSQFNHQPSADVSLTLTSKDSLASISLHLHRQILVANSRFFAAKLSDRWSKQQRSLPHLVDISDCDDVEVYIETLRLMYCKDLRRRLMREEVVKVLGILKVSAAIGFDAGVLSCLEYLEAAPWAEDEEDMVASLLSQLKLESEGAGEVLKRVSMEVTAVEDSNGDGEEILARLLQVVLEGKDEKARREMKGLVSKMLRENTSNGGGGGRGGGGDLSRESLYSAFAGCLKLLRYYFVRVAAASDTADAAQISRQADNLHWILDILIDRQIADEFLRVWAGQTELAEMHSKVAAIHRYEVSWVTARLFVGIGKGQVLVSKETRCLLLKTWLEPFYEDFGWMRRACKGLDRHSIEDGLGNTILTLPLGMQQEILLAWFDRFLNSGDDCPNIQRGFEVWWRRAFWKRNGEQGTVPPQLRVASVCENSC